MATTYAKVIATQSFALGANNTSESYSIGQTYEIDSTKATQYIASGMMVDFATALSSPKCPPFIRTKPKRIG